MKRLVQKKDEEDTEDEWKVIKEELFKLTVILYL